MAIYDLGLKFRGLEGFCGQNFSNHQLGTALYGRTTEDEGLERQISRLTAGERTLGPDQQIKLSQEFNSVIARLMGSNNPGAARGPIRPEDWAKPAPEFFAQLAECYGDSATERLDDAHGAIVAALNELARYRQMSTDLVIDRFLPNASNAKRIPEIATPVDPLTLPPKRLSPREPMVVSLARPIAADSRGWLFYIRNPDTHDSPTVRRWVWEEDTANLIFWHPSPFRLSAGFWGPLPDYPSPVRDLSGEMTAYLIIEPAESTAVLNLLQNVGSPWDPAKPNYEATAHLIERGRKLFQAGHKSKTVAYPPPTLLTRRYHVR